MATGKRKQRTPWDVSLGDDERRKLGIWMCDQITNGLDARAVAERECDYWHLLYEQGRTRQSSAAPWPGAADLTSYLGTQNVDALHARLMKTVWVEPIWNVEGWGQAAGNAPFVEEFHQWKAEETRLQSVLDRWALISLIEPRGLLEVTEGTQQRPVRKEMWAQLLMAGDPLTGEPKPVFDDTGKAQLATDERGKYIEAQEVDPMTGMPIPAAQVIVDGLEAVRTGPQCRVIPYRDSLIFPGHARDKEEIWGYGKRIYRRISELREMAERGIYDTTVIEKMSTVSDREPDAALQRSGHTVAEQEKDTVEKELWECTILKDLGDGERWYVLTVNPSSQQLLRIQYDDLDRARYIPIILFPRPDRATEGFSFVGHKLITTIEEHTAWRNMIADRGQMVAQQPIKKLQGALWDEYEQPWGAGTVITVRDMKEVEPFVMPDVPQSLMQRETVMERTAERLAGVNDIASGQTIQGADKTLGEVQMATEQSFVRMDMVIRRFQEGMEDLAQILHAIWKRTLAEQGGVEVPESVLVGLESRGAQVPGGKLTAQMLDGQFRFKPRGSVETADPRAMRADFVQMMQAFPAFLQTLMMIGQTFGPMAARAMLDQFIRVFRVSNRAAFVGQGAGPTPGMMPVPMLGAGQANGPQVVPGPQGMQ